MRTHHSFLHTVLEQDEEKDADRHRDLKKNKFTLTECFIALTISLACVSLHAIFLGDYHHQAVTILADIHQI